MKRTLLLAVVVSMCVAPLATKAADAVGYDTVLGVSYLSQSSVLPNTADYSWWYGCSPTAAGMAMAYYDLNGYAGLSYSNLIAGGEAETTTFPSTAGVWTYLAQYAIASPGHVSDFYRSGYGTSGDDSYSGRSYDCLADFMGTSQDSIGNLNGGTQFYYYTNGTPLTYEDCLTLGIASYDGMYGIGEYITYCGYSVSTLYTQLTDNIRGAIYGFTFEDYMAEIDAGRVVLIQLAGHTVLGVGYGDDYTVYLYDTWYLGLDSMTWGGSYSGLAMYAVTVFELAGGEAVVPLPGAVLLATLGAGCVSWLRRRGTLAA